MQNDIKIHAKIGPYFAIGLAAKNKWEEGYRSNSDKHEVKGFGKGDEEECETGLKRGDIGFLLGLGVTKGHYSWA